MAAISGRTRFQLEARDLSAGEIIFAEVCGIDESLGFFVCFKCRQGLFHRFQLVSLPAYKIASIPLRRMTLSSASAAPVGLLAPRSNCET